MDLNEFSKKFCEIKKMGWIASKRKGPTGVGQTLESLLGLRENNISLPDLGKIELKAHRINSSSLITLFTFNRKAWKINPIDAIRKYGTPDQKGRLGLYFTMSPTPNSAGLFLTIEENAISVRHISGELIAEWKTEAIAQRFLKKIPALIVVRAFSEMRGEQEWFKFERANILSGTTSEIIHNQIQEGNIILDLRLHDKGTSARNHGTGFRAKESNLTLLFQSCKDV
jgi:hypothetical protein